MWCLCGDRGVRVTGVCGRMMFERSCILLDLNVCSRLQSDAENGALWLEIVSDLPEMCEDVTKM